MPRLMTIAVALGLAMFLAGGSDVTPLAAFAGADASLLSAGDAPLPELPEHDGDASELETTSSEVGTSDLACTGRLRDSGVLVVWPDAGMPPSHVHPPILPPPIA